MIPQFFDVLEAKFQTEFKWDTNERGGMLQRMKNFLSAPPLGKLANEVSLRGLFNFQRLCYNNPQNGSSGPSAGLFTR